MTLADARLRLRPHVPALVPGLIAIGLMLVWAVHNGGYDTDTWYWGALVLLAAVAVLCALRSRQLRLSRPLAVALAAFALYVAWSYLSITWAQSRGDALAGSNRALLYLLLFAFCVLLPWTAEGALVALLVFVIGVGVIAVVLLFRLASATNVAQIVQGGRLLAPTGYFNSTVALFTMEAFAAIALAARRALPGPLRGLLIAFACASLQLALVGDSRGWLFTLPLMVVVTFLLVTDRLRVAAIASLPLVGVLVPVHRLLAVYKASTPAALNHASTRAGDISLLLCAGALFLGTLLAWGDGLAKPRPLSRNRRRQLGAVLTGAVIAAACAGGVIATHGHPFRFVSRQWHGFVHSSVETSASSNFGVVGTGRLDFWRVSLKAFAAHPIGGLGQDNFVDYYLLHRHTAQEPAWTHSIELRLLAHTGIVGFLLFTTFLVAALVTALGVRRRGGDMARWVAGAALLPLVVWLIHGSLDWFWEMPALSGPALGFLAVVGALGRLKAPEREDRSTRASPEPSALRFSQAKTGRRAVAAVAGAVAFCAALVGLGFPYLAVREISAASDISSNNPLQALRDLQRASDLDPWNADAGRFAGTIALQTSQFTIAEQRFRQAITRDPGGWYAWLGAGLAASQLGQSSIAYHDFREAARINSRQPAVTTALARVYSSHPLTPSQALQMIVLAH